MSDQTLLAEISRVALEADLLFDRVTVETALDTMAAAIAEQLADTNPLILSVMIGGIVPTGNLLKRLRFPLELDYVHATRYRGHTRGGDLHWIKRPAISLQDRTVLVVDDVLDEGVTLAAIVNDCQAKGAAQVLTAVLVEKQLQPMASKHRAQFVGLKAVNRYLFGFGMDYKAYLRNADGIYAVREM
ncbi:MAG: hypoxanthine-guanine phosphoribosyltransferase [Gammaproteobacteria bacterium]